MMKEIKYLHSIEEAYQQFAIAKPQHPLISIRNIDEFIHYNFTDTSYVFGFYHISLQVNQGATGHILYGQNRYEVPLIGRHLLFSKPGQALRFTGFNKLAYLEGWTLCFHPDLLERSNLNKVIEKLSLFNYELSEALRISQAEAHILSGLINIINDESSKKTDNHSTPIIVTTLELFLNYCQRFYERQISKPASVNHDIVSRFDALLSNYFNSEKPQEFGLPSVSYCSAAMNISPDYLSYLLKKVTGKNAHTHIQEQIIKTAKNNLISSNISINQLTFQLGFSYSQHFCKYFRSVTGMTPTQFRKHAITSP